ncbi:MAG: hypothetical protein PHF73_13230, partial [Massilibacteroides sp.]|nr:hypothetical protein [Massilibacteroides sp.]
MKKSSIGGETTFNNISHVLRIMKITICLFFSCILFIGATNSYSQETTFTLNLKSTSIKQVCERIEKESDFL